MQDLSERFKVQVVSGWSCPDQNVLSRFSYARVRQPERPNTLSQTPLQPVSAHDSVTIPRHQNSRSRPVARGRCSEELEGTAAPPGTGTEQGAHLSPPFHAGRLWIAKAAPVDQGSGCSFGGLPAVLRADLVAHREGVTTLPAAAGQNLPTGPSLHAGPEAVVLQSLASTWIPERRLHLVLALTSGRWPRFT